MPKAPGLDPKTPGDFAREASRPRQGAAREFTHFLRHNKKWWLTPIILSLLVIAGLVILGGTVVAPFIYTLF